MTKPTDPEELTARIRALLHREGGLAEFLPTELILSRHCCPPKPSPDGIWQLRSGWKASNDRWRSRAAR